MDIDGHFSQLQPPSVPHRIPLPRPTRCAIPYDVSESSVNQPNILTLYAMPERMGFTTDHAIGTLFPSGVGKGILPTNDFATVRIRLL